MVTILKSALEEVHSVDLALTSESRSTVHRTTCVHGRHSLHVYLWTSHSLDPNSSHCQRQCTVEQRIISAHPPPIPEFARAVQ